MNGCAEPPVTAHPHSFIKLALGYCYLCILFLAADAQ